MNGIRGRVGRKVRSGLELGGENWTPSDWRRSAEPEDDVDAREPC